jgi:hypothetical protein
MASGGASLGATGIEPDLQSKHGADEFVSCGILQGYGDAQFVGDTSRHNVTSRFSQKLKSVLARRRNARVFRPLGIGKDFVAVIYVEKVSFHGTSSVQ